MSDLQDQISQLRKDADLNREVLAAQMRTLLEETQRDRTALRSLSDRAIVTRLPEDNETNQRTVAGTGTAVGVGIVSGAGKSMTTGQGELTIKGHAPTIEVSELVFSSRIWGGSQSDILLAIDRAELEIEAIRTVVRAFRSQPDLDARKDNDPPELVDDPGVDLEQLDTALQCLKVLRKLLLQPEPDLDVLLLIWFALQAALNGALKFIVWAAHVSESALSSLANSTIGESFKKGLGDALGKATAAGLVYELVENGPTWTRRVEGIVKGALAVLGHPI